MNESSTLEQTLPDEKLDKKALFALAMMTFTTLLGFGLMMPFISFLAVYNHAAPWVVGAATAFYSFGQLLSASFWGYISDTRGRRIVLIISQIGFCVAWLLIALPWGIKWLLFTRLLAGLFSGNIAVTFAAAADIGGPKNFTKANGIIGASLAMGFTFGPALGSILGKFVEVPLLFIVAPLVSTFFSVLALLIVIFWVKEPLKAEQLKKNKHFHQNKPPFLKLLKELLISNGVVWRIFSVLFLVTLSWAGLEVLLALFGLHIFKFDFSQLVLFYVLLGITLSAVQGAVTPRLEKLSRFKSFFLGSFLIFWGFILLSCGNLLLETRLAEEIAFGVSLALIGGGMGLLSPLMNTYILEVSPSSERGFMMGLARSTGTLGRFVGPLFFGPLFGLKENLPFAVAGFLILIAFLFYLSFRKKLLSLKKKDT